MACGQLSYFSICFDDLVYMQVYTLCMYAHFYLNIFYLHWNLLTIQNLLKFKCVIDMQI